MIDAAKVEAAKVEAAVNEAVQAERSRALAILAHAEAVGRADLARTCVTSGLSVEDAAVIMAAAGRDTPPADSAHDFAAIAQQIRADRAKNAAAIASLPAIGGDAAVAAEIARQGLTAADVSEIYAAAKPAA